MLELIFLLACILVYLFSFLYRRIAVLASILIVYFAFWTSVNEPFVLGLILILTLIRFKKTGLKDEF